MRLIDAEHLEKWILARWGEQKWDSHVVEPILYQIEREDYLVKCPNRGARMDEVGE